MPYQVARTSLFLAIAFQNAPNPKFVPAIIFEGSSGGLESVKNLSKYEKQ